MRRSILLLLCAGGIAGAQTPSDPMQWAFGAAAGQLRFSDGARESALGLTIGAQAWGWLDVSVNPTYAWAESAPVAAGSGGLMQRRRVSGMTDLPVSVGVSHELPGPWAPSIGVSLGITLPTGDTATLGAGTTGVGGNLDVGFSPAENVSFDVGAGRSFSDGFSAGLASSASTSLALSTLFKVGPAGIGLTVAGDVGAVPVGFENGRSIGGGVSVPIAGNISLNLDGSAGLTKGSLDWTYAVSIGTTPSGVVAATTAPYQRLRRAFGIGTKIKNKPRTKGP